MWNELFCYVVFLLSVVGLGLCQTCYHCNQIQASPTDPGLSNAIYQLSQRQPANTQCSNFPYQASNGIPTINCQTLNYSMYGNPMSGIPFTGWKCMKQTYTITFKNYGNGQTVVVPGVVRGCIPIQYQNPFDYNNCYQFSASTNPYVRALLSSMYFPLDNVGPIVGNEGGASGNSGLGSWSESSSGNYGEVCMCSNNYCNKGMKSLGSISLMLCLASALFSWIMYGLR